MKKPIAAAAAFLACILLANWSTSHFGLVPIGLGLLVSAGTFAAGLALLTRDVVQDAAGRAAVVALIVIGAGLSWFVSDGRIAIASGIAFLLSELADMAIYTPLREASWTGAVLASNAVGGLLDSLLFLSIAGFGITAGAVAGQWLVKIAVTLATVLLIGGARAVLREPLNAEGA